MTKSLFLAVCALLVFVVLCEEEPKKGGAEQRPGKTANKQNDGLSSLFKIPSVTDIAPNECEV